VYRQEGEQMIEYDETEHASCAVTDEELHLVRLFNGHEVGDKLLFRWDDMHLYSSELQQAINIVTGGHPPGQPKEEAV
jgi:hypothetical protein